MRYYNMNDMVAACERDRTGNYGDCGTRRRVAYYCEECGEPIYDGESYIHEYVPICEDCMRHMSAEKFCELNLIHYEIAEA